MLVSRRKPCHLSDLYITTSIISSFHPPNDSISAWWCKGSRILWFLYTSWSGPATSFCSTPSLGAKGVEGWGMYKIMLMNDTCWWSRNPVNSPVEVGGLWWFIPLFYKVLYIPGRISSIDSRMFFEVSPFLLGLVRSRTSPLLWTHLSTSKKNGLNVCWNKKQNFHVSTRKMF